MEPVPALDQGFSSPMAAESLPSLYAFTHFDFSLANRTPTIRDFHFGFCSSPYGSLEINAEAQTEPQETLSIPFPEKVNPVWKRRNFGGKPVGFRFLVCWADTKSASRQKSISTRLDSVNFPSFATDFGRCEQVVKQWAVASLADEVKEDRHTLKDLLFFLHIPRTVGCALVDCFLLKFYPRPLRCLHPFDLQNDPRQKGCRLMASHDDYSVSSKLPKDTTSTVTILRNPVDRVLSMSEFTVEVAARFLVFHNQSTVTLSTVYQHPLNGLGTMHVWPWKYLVPWMREDLFARRDARKLRGAEDVKSNDPYDMEEMAMPLLEYINDRVAHDTVHNGATFQALRRLCFCHMKLVPASITHIIEKMILHFDSMITGLTNNTHLVGALEVRNCVQTYKTLEEHMLQVAKRKLDNMLFIALAEDLRNALSLFRNLVGEQIVSQIAGMGDSSSNFSEMDPSFSDSELYHQMSTREFMDVYDACDQSAQRRRVFRRNTALINISPVNFTKEMAHACRFTGLLLMILIFGDTSQYAAAYLNTSSITPNFALCRRMVKEWQFLSFDDEFMEDDQTLRDLLLFLHIPQTGGATFLECFLKSLFPSNLQCHSSASMKDCRLIVTEDDYSLMSKLPQDRTSIMTIMRNPVDRVISAYEFSKEMAGRFLNHGNQSSPAIMAMDDAISISSIWPWKYLIPWMIKDMSAREVGMPLSEYINDATVFDLLHNGATFQITGLTNNSHYTKAHQVRSCLQKYEALGELVLEVARRRLDNMLFVGLTEEHKKSVSLFSKVLGAQHVSQLIASTRSRRSEALEPSSSQSDSELDSDAVVALELMDAYEACTSRQQSRHMNRSMNHGHMKNISEVNFSKVPESLIEQIRSLNSLDIKLYQYARDLFEGADMKPAKDPVSKASMAVLDKVCCHFLPSQTTKPPNCSSF